MHKRIKGHDELVRDPYSKAIVNTDRTALENHRRKIQRMNRMEEKQDKIESDISEIKKLISDCIAQINSMD